LEALGAQVEIRQGKVHARAMNGKHLVGGHFCLDYPSVGATETLMMAAALADGKSTLSNVAQVHKLLMKQYIPTHYPSLLSLAALSHC
jgi:UDP-N-acetylglucosamine 1-carboxyvinyltransferase